MFNENEITREMREAEARRKDEEDRNPLLKYSTSQLKAELRRRKKEWQ